MRRSDSAARRALTPRDCASTDSSEENDTNTPLSEGMAPNESLASSGTRNSDRHAPSCAEKHSSTHEISAGECCDDEKEEEAEAEEAEEEIDES